MSQGFDSAVPEFQSDLLSGPVRTNFNAVATNHAGSQAPVDPQTGWLWFDTSNPLSLNIKQFFDGSWHVILANVQAGPPAQSSIQKFVHDQAAPATTWVINHLLGSQNVVIAIYDGSNNEILPHEKHIVSSNQATLTFLVAQLGRAVVIG